MDTIENLNCDKIAAMIKATLAVRGISQLELAKMIGVNRALVNMFLTRKIDLRPHDIAAILQHLNLEKIAHKLSAPANFE